MKALCTWLLVLALAAPQALCAADEVPVLPDASQSEVKDAPPETGVAGGSAEVETPSEAPAVKRSIKITPEKPSTFRWGNFFLGALGGGILAGGAGFFFFTQSDKDGSIDYDKVRTIVPIAVGGGAALGGLLSVLLGLTTPQDAPPPEMNSSLGGPSLALLPLADGQAVVWTAHF